MKRVRGIRWDRLRLLDFVGRIRRITFRRSVYEGI